MVEAILASPMHEWTDGQDAAEADRLRAFYKDKFFNNPELPK